MIPPDNIPVILIDGIKYYAVCVSPKDLSTNVLSTIFPGTDAS